MTLDMMDCRNNLLKNNMLPHHTAILNTLVSFGLCSFYPSLKIVLHTLESRIDIGQGINVGPGKFV